MTASAMDGARPPKRKRTTTAVHETPTSEVIEDAEQLRRLMTFQQDLGQARHGLQSFKDLLDSILNEEPGGGVHKLPIVVQILEQTRPRVSLGESEDGEASNGPIYLADVMNIWSMASQMGNENVMSAVTVVLALLLKLVSTHLELWPIGLGISRTILQQRQLPLLAKNLSAEKGKDFVISPTLRLLREMICLDGGTLVASVFRARNYTLKSLARNMGLKYIGEGVEDPKRPSVRTNAVRVLTSILKFLHPEAKRDLLAQKDVVAALMRSLKEDPPSLIFEILDTLRTSVVLDQKLPRDSKIRLLNSQSLIRIASLYSYAYTPSGGADRQFVDKAAHDFLIAACTSSSAGILRQQQGFYPTGVDPDDTTMVDSDGNIGLENITWMSQFDEHVPVRNTLLSEFIQSLRPWASTNQNELLVTIFRASPELVADYFANKRSFNFDPKLSATWIGYATLLFNTIKLEIPQYLGRHKSYARLPPPTSIVIGNILPLPLDLKTISRCLNQTSSLVRFFAIRLLVLALEKLSLVLKMYREASSDAVWNEAARSLIEGICRRIPPLKDVIGVYRGLGDDDLLQRNTVSRLLLLYHEVIPQVAIAAKFDFSPMLSAAIKRLEASEQGTEDASFRLIELENLFIMAQHSPTMKWCSRGKDLALSPFTTLLRLYIGKGQQGLSSDKLRTVLSFVTQEQKLVERTEQHSGLTSLCEALAHPLAEIVSDSVWSFIDNCAERCSKTPLKYFEAVYDIANEHSEKASTNREESSSMLLSPLMCTMAEQLSYIVKGSNQSSELVQIADFISTFLGFTEASGVHHDVVKIMLRKFKKAFGDPKTAKMLTINRAARVLDVNETPSASERPSGRLDSRVVPAGTITLDQLRELLSVPLKAKKDNNALTRWSHKTPEELVEEGYAASVVWLLASEHASIRKEAATSLLKMAAKIKESSYDEKEQVWLLLMELTESAKPALRTAPISNIILAFATRSLEVIKDPTHRVYPKLNTFLTRGPTWELDKIPLAQPILEDGPTEDDAHYSEVSWLTAYLLDGLRSPEDVTIFHKRKTFERLLALFSNPDMGHNLRTQILRIIYRATSIESGSNTLITRCGLLNWLAQEKSLASPGEDGIYQALRERLWETCDKRRMAEWSKGAFGDIEASSRTD